MARDSSGTYLEGVRDGLEMRLQEAGQLAAARRRFLSSFLRHGAGGGRGVASPREAGLRRRRGRGEEAAVGGSVRVYSVWAWAAWC